MSSAYAFAKRHELAGRLRKIADGLIDNAFSQNDVLKPALYALANELAAVSSSSVAEPWQPIESAPKDGTWILLRGESGYINRPYRVHVGHWDAEYRPHNPWQTSEGNCFEDDGDPPTHWMVLQNNC